MENVPGIVSSVQSAISSEFQSRWGHHPCSYQTYLRLKRLHKDFWIHVRRIVAAHRWDLRAETRLSKKQRKAMAKGARPAFCPAFAPPAYFKPAPDGTGALRWRDPETGKMRWNPEKCCHKGRFERTGPSIEGSYAFWFPANGATRWENHPLRQLFIRARTPSAQPVPLFTTEEIGYLDRLEDAYKAWRYARAAAIHDRLRSMTLPQVCRVIGRASPDAKVPEMYQSLKSGLADLSVALFHNDALNEKGL